MNYLKQFMFFSIIGFLFETLVSLISHNNFNSGILNGPYTPIYGFGILIIIYESDFLFKHIHLKRYQEIIIVFGILFFTITFLELLGGVLIERTFHKIFWSYKKLKFNYGHYIAIEISLLWSLMGIIIYYCKDFFYKLIIKIPNFIYYLFYIIFIIDIIYTISNI